jgi:hypothetical protein
MHECEPRPAPTLVEAVDRVTRAVHLGARLPGGSGRPLDAVSRAYLGGFIAALVGALRLDSGFAELVVYAYLLQEGLESDAARLSPVMLLRPDLPELAEAFEAGQEEARIYLGPDRDGLPAAG